MTSTTTTITTTVTDTIVPMSSDGHNCLLIRRYREVQPPIAAKIVQIEEDNDVVLDDEDDRCIDWLQQLQLGDTAESTTPTTTTNTTTESHSTPVWPELLCAASSDALVGELDVDSFFLASFRPGLNRSRKGLARDQYQGMPEHQPSGPRSSWRKSVLEPALTEVDSLFAPAVPGKTKKVHHSASGKNFLSFAQAVVRNTKKFLADNVDSLIEVIYYRCQHALRTEPKSAIKQISRNFVDKREGPLLLQVHFGALPGEVLALVMTRGTSFLTACIDTTQKLNQLMSWFGRAQAGCNFRF
ncbi:hypothetical protein TKK_0018202 [Trichogramma kaykai]